MLVKLAPRVSRYCPGIVKGEHYGLEADVGHTRYWATDSVGLVERYKYSRYYGLVFGCGYNLYIQIRVKK